MSLRTLFTSPLSRNCLSCGQPLRISALLKGSKRAVFDTQTPPHTCPACGAGQRFSARSTTAWFLGLMAPILWFGFGPASAWMARTFPNLLVFDRQDYALGPGGFALLAFFYFLPASLIARLVALHLARLETIS